MSKSKIDSDTFSNVTRLQQIVKATLELWFQVFTCFVVADEAGGEKS